MDGLGIVFSLQDKTATVPNLFIIFILFYFIIYIYILFKKNVCFSIHIIKKKFIFIFNFVYYILKKKFL